MKRTNIKARVKDGTSWLTRTIFEEDGAHYIKCDGRYVQITKTDRGTYRAGWLFNRVEYIAE